ncbi:MAG: hypothetical protein NTY32_10685 [Bacteroidia bacterium]|nr:hypothetical protein [Bacteroidia bacterium]
MKISEKIVVEKDITKGTEKWWGNVLDVCGNDIDMLSIHWYYHQNQLPNIEPKLNELKSFVSKKMNGKHYKWCLSEYNCNTENDAERVVGLAEGLGHFLNVGFDVSTFWPMRIGGMEQRSMFSLNNIEPHYPYQLFQLFNRELKGNMVKCVSSDNTVAFASASIDQITIVIFGSTLKRNSNLSICIPDCDLGSKNVSVKRYSAVLIGKKNVALQNESIDFLNQKNSISSTIIPNTFNVISITN